MDIANWEPFEFWLRSSMEAKVCDASLCSACGKGRRFKSGRAAVEARGPAGRTEAKVKVFFVQRDHEMMSVHILCYCIYVYIYML